MDTTALLPYMRRIVKALKNVNGGAATGSGGKASVAGGSLQLTGDLSTTDIIEALDTALLSTVTETGQGGTTTTTQQSALELLKDAIVDELHSAFFTTVIEDGDTVEKSLLELVRDEVAEFKELNLRNIIRHMSLQTIDSGLATEQQYLLLDIGLASTGFGSFGGLNQGGGSGGGGSLSSLADTAIASLADGQILVYDGNSSSATFTKWVNRTPTLDTLSGVSTTGVQNGQTLVYNNGSWSPASVVTNITVTSANADIGTSLTTIATIQGTAIQAKITHQTVTLAGGTNNGTLKLTTAAGTTDNIPVTGLKALAFKDTQFVLGNQTQDQADDGTLLGVLGISKYLTPPSGDLSSISWDGDYNAWRYKGNLIVEGWGSFGGVNPGSGSGTDLDAVWKSLRNDPADSHAGDKIHVNHIPIGDGLSISGGKIVASISGPVGVDKGGTGLTSITAYSMLYAPAADTLAALAPNTTATKKYLSMTGNGTTGAAPAWSALAYADISDLSSWTGSSAITTLGTIETGVWQGTAIAYDYLAALYLGTTRIQGTSTPQPVTGITTLTASTSITSPKYYLNANVFFEIDSSGNVHLTSSNNSNPGFYADGFGSFGGLNGGSSTGVTLDRVWESLQNNTDSPNTKINLAHIALGDGLQISANAIAVNATVVRTAYDGGLNMYICDSSHPLPAQGSRDPNTLYIETT